MDVSETGIRVDNRRPIAEYGVGDAHAVAGPRVLNARLHDAAILLLLASGRGLARGGDDRPHPNRFADTLERLLAAVLEGDAGRSAG